MRMFVDCAGHALGAFFSVVFDTVSDAASDRYCMVREPFEVSVRERCIHDLG